MKRYSEAERALFVQKFKHTGKSVGVFSKAHGLGNGTLRSWLAKERGASLTPFVPATVPSALDAFSEEERVEIVHSCGVKLTCTAQFPAQWASNFFGRLR